jgi:hypothetical protein
LTIVKLITIFHFFIVVVWGYIVAFIKVLTIYQIYHRWIHTLHHSPLFPYPLISRMVSTSIIFPLTSICTSYLHYIHPPMPFPHLLLALTGTNPPTPVRTCSTLLFSDFVKENKNDIFVWLW